MEYTLKLTGRSGCEIGLVYHDGLPVVRKYSKSIAYNERLIRQAEKQQRFLQGPAAQIFSSPRVMALGKGSHESLAWLEMEYVHAEKYSDFLERIGIPEIRSLAEAFRRYFSVMIDKAQKVNLPESVFLEKLQSLRTEIRPDSGFNDHLLHDVYTYLGNVPQGEILVGECHGDYTFSNMLFGDQQLFLIDFLDTFVESPVQDIVKFRQDTRYHWSLMVEGEVPLYKRNKLVQVLTFLDQVGQEVIDRNPLVKTWYTYLQVFNLLRILPYLHEQHEIKFVESALEQTI